MRANVTGLLVWAALAVAWSWQQLAAHPIHETIGEARLNRSRGAFEVSLRVSPSDLLKELGGAFDLHTNNPSTVRAVDDRIRKLIEHNFTVKAVDGTALPMTWVGREFDSKKAYLWLHFSFAVPSETKRLRVSNGLFLRMEEWTNRLLVEWDGKRETLTFDRARTEASISP